MVSASGSFRPYDLTVVGVHDLRRFEIVEAELATPTGAWPYTICHMRPFVCILAVTNAGTTDARLTLVRQFRYAVDDWQLEPPAGGIEEGEEPLAAALRELREESGLIVDEIEELGWTYPSGGSTNERAYLFCARCTRRVERDLDAGEQVETVLVTREEMEELLVGDGSPYAHAVTYVAWMRMQACGLLDAWMPRR